MTDPRYSQLREYGPAALDDDFTLPSFEYRGFRLTNTEVTGPADLGEWARLLPQLRREYHPFQPFMRAVVDHAIDNGCPPLLEIAVPC